MELKCLKEYLDKCCSSKSICLSCLQCFDAVGWTARRASGL